MRDLLRTDPKQMGSQNKLFDEWKKELRQYFISLDFRKAGEQNLWSVIDIFDACKTHQQIARPFVGPIIPLEPKFDATPCLEKSKSTAYQLSIQIFPGMYMGCVLNLGRELDW